MPDTDTRPTRPPRMVGNLLRLAASEMEVPFASRLAVIRVTHDDSRGRGARDAWRVGYIVDDTTPVRYRHDATVHYLHDPDSPFRTLERFRRWHDVDQYVAGVERGLYLARDMRAVVELGEITPRRVRPRMDSMF